MKKDDNAIRVKFLARGTKGPDHRIWLRQFPGCVPSWGNCEFIFNQNETNYDWLVVYDDLPAKPGQRFSYRAEELMCAPHNTALITTEPSTIRHYGHRFLRQFGYVITSQEPEIIDHPGAIYTQPGLRWFYGVGSERFLTHDEMSVEDVWNKTKRFSTVCSSKRQRHTTHAQRFRFTQYLAQKYSAMDLYGHGIRPVNDKAETIRPYRYHLAIENYIGRHHITEKLMDVYLGGALPLYAGCPNANEYFPEESFISIELSDFDEAVYKIIQIVESDEFEKRIPAIRKAKEMVLNKYNIFALLSDHIEKLTENPNLDSLELTSGTTILKSRRAIWKQSPDAWLESFYFKIKNRLKGGSQSI